MNKPKVLLVADTYYPKVDGTMIFMEEFIKRSSEFDISLMVPNFGKRKGENVTYIKPSKHISISGYKQSFGLYWSNWSKLKKAIKEADVVFVQGPAMISYLSLYYSKKYSKKTVFYTHTIAWELFENFFPPLLNKLFFSFIKRMSIMLYNRCDEVLVPYDELAGNMKRAGVKAKLTVARLGVDIERFKPSADKRLSKRKMGMKEDSFVVGYVGRISKEKNTKTLVRAFAKPDMPENFSLLMVGDGPDDQVKGCKDMEKCKVSGFVNNVQDYLKAIDVFVMPSLTETTSLATLEAMACGLPVIVTKVGYMKKYIEKGRNGLFFPRNNSTILSMKLKKLYNDSELREKLGRNARKTVAYAFSWERSINKIKRVLIKQVNS